MAEDELTLTDVLSDLDWHDHLFVDENGVFWRIRTEQSPQNSSSFTIEKRSGTNWETVHSCQSSSPRPVSICQHANFIYFSYDNAIYAINTETGKVEKEAEAAAAGQGNIQLTAATDQYLIFYNLGFFRYHIGEGRVTLDHHLMNAHPSTYFSKRFVIAVDRKGKFHISSHDGLAPRDVSVELCVREYIGAVEDVFFCARVIDGRQELQALDARTMHVYTFKTPSLTHGRISGYKDGTLYIQFPSKLVSTKLPEDLVTVIADQHANEWVEEIEEEKVLPHVESELSLLKKEFEQVKKELEEQKRENERLRKLTVNGKAA